MGTLPYLKSVPLNMAEFGCARSLTPRSCFGTLLIIALLMCICLYYSEYNVKYFNISTADINIKNDTTYKRKVVTVTNEEALVPPCPMKQLPVHISSRNSTSINCSFDKFEIYLTPKSNSTRSTRKQEDSLYAQRKMIEFEMQDFNYTAHNYSSLDDLVPELGGTPLRSVLVTTWRSGSTFLGGILNSHPGDWHHYEPLLHMGIVQIRGPPLAKPAIETLSQLLHCKYDNLRDLLEYGKIDKDVFQYNKRLWKYCQSFYDRNSCYDPEFMNSMCKLFPVQSMKVVRVRLELAGRLLEDEELGVKMMLMVRDPRGTIQSRYYREWCPGSPDCDEPELLCADLKANYYAALELAVKYPSHFTVIRYEDFSSHPYIETKNLFKFLNLDVHKEVYKYLDTHTKNKSGGAWSTHRNSKTAPFHWQQDMNFEIANEIQNICAEAMELWGYVPAHNGSHMQTFHPLRPFFFYKSGS